MKNTAPELTESILTWRIQLQNLLKVHANKKQGGTDTFNSLYELAYIK